MLPTSEFMAEVSLAHSYPELFRVTGPLLSLVLQTKDVWQRYSQFLEAFRCSQSGFPLLTRRRDHCDFVSVGFVVT